MINILKYTNMISFIWGFALAVIFRKVCDKNNCFTVKAPKSANGVYKFDDKCYRFTPYAVSCNSN